MTGRWRRGARNAAAITTAEPEAFPDATGLRRAYFHRMTMSNLSMAEIAALVGNPARANVLNVLMDGRALTATELAYVAGVSPQTTSGHLGRLTEAGLLAVLRQGRHAYYRLSSPLVGRMLEGIMAVAAESVPRHQSHWRGGEALRTARTCYDHLAGRLGVALTDALTEREHVLLGEDGGVVTEAGEKFLADFGIDVGEIKQGKRVFCRPCIDWSERRLHLAGAVGAALATRCLDLGWLRRQRDTRAVAITEPGRRGLADHFDIRLDAAA
ncbi:MAG TPA: helix-turn-helix transcriptional regulator [Stellaceae bacterium]|jgi:DNA-binding transcriptional ArsR family regulator|nr:helix-turn-helix transcriptional regulator [Stellaceae bacterium]